LHSRGRAAKICRVDAMTIAMVVSMFAGGADPPAGDGVWRERPVRQPVIDRGPTGSWDHHAVDNPFVFLQDGTYYCFYEAQDRPFNQGGHERIGLAVSTDSVHWRKYEGNPVLDVGESGQWDRIVAKLPTVVRHADRYWLFYSGRDPAGKQIGLAVSDDLRHWHKHASNPVLARRPGRWDAQLSTHPAPVVQRGGRFFMLYRGMKGFYHQQGLGLAVSDDLIHWRRHCDGPVLPPGEECYSMAMTPGGSGYWAIAQARKRRYWTTDDLVTWRAGPEPRFDGASVETLSNPFRCGGRWVVLYEQKDRIYRAVATADRPRAPENLVNVSWGDQIMIARGDARLDTPGKIRRSLEAWRRADSVKTILWRGSAYSLRRYYERRRKAGGFADAYYRKVQQVLDVFDPLTTARQAARANGQTFLIYLTIFDHGAPPSVLYAGTTPFPWQDRLTIENPQLQTLDRQGRYQHGVLELAYPQARRVMIERIVGFVREFGTDGVYVCTRTHSLPALHADQFGFSPPVVEAFKQRHGVDIRTDRRFDCTRGDYDAKGELVEAWRRLRGEYLVRFYRELQAALPGKVIYTGIPRGRYLGPPYGNVYLDWESLVRERLVHGLVIGVYSGKGLHGKLYVPHAKIGYLSSEDDAIGIPDAERALREVYGPLCTVHGVKLFFNSGHFGPRQRRWFDRAAELSGFMIDTPSGATGRAVIAHDDALNFPGGQMTVEAQVYPRHFPAGHEMTPRILSKYDHLEHNTLRGWEWIVRPGGIVQFRVNQAPPAGDVTLTTTTPLKRNAWNHVATVYDAKRQEMRIYLDGKLNAKRSIPAHPLRVNREQDLFIGRYGGRDTAIFDGMIDEVRLTAAALTFDGMPVEPYSGREPNTVALYHFDRLTDGGRFEDAAPGHCRPAVLPRVGERTLVNSAPGFGRALNLETAGPTAPSCSTSCSTTRESTTKSGNGS